MRPDDARLAGGGWPARLLPLLRAGLLAGAAAYAIVFCVVTVLRIGYDFELEWMEGATVDHIQRVLDGEPVYVRPSLEFIPFLYSPLYYYVGAGLFKVFGVGFVPLRVLSLLSSLGVFVLLGRFVFRETKDLTAALLATGLFVATYRAGGAWFDLARVDNFWLLLLVGALYLIRFGRGARTHVAAGLLLAAAFFTKQTAWVLVAPLLLHDLLFARRRCLAVFAPFGVLAALGTLWLHHATDGWHTFYAWRLPFQHEVEGRMWVDFWREDMLGWLPVGLALAAYGVLARLGKTTRSDGLFFLFAAMAFGGAAWSARLHAGGYQNVLIPGFWIVALGFGLGCASLRRTRPLFQACVLLACFYQFFILAYDPREQVPTAADEAAGRRLIEMTRAMEGEVYMPFHGYLPRMAGHRTHAHEMAIRDIFKGTDTTLQRELRAEMTEAFRSHRFARIVLDHNTVFDGLEDYYEVEGPVFEDGAYYEPGQVFLTVTGKETRPMRVYRPKAK